MGSRVKRGKVYIFNVFSFNDGDLRSGSLEDVDKLRDAFEAMNSDVEDHPNISESKLKRKMKEIKKKDFSEFDYVAIAFCSHGCEDNVAALYQCRIHLDSTLMQPMIENVTLARKLKWLIVQTCKGPLVHLTSEGFAGIGDPMRIEQVRYCLTSYATTEGCVAWRNDYGSPFIQILCDVLQKYYKEQDIISISKIVRDKVENDCRKHGMIQMPATEDNFGGLYSFSFMKD